MNKLTQLLDLIREIVDDTSMNWTDKRDKIREEVKEYEGWEISLDEFLSWFDGAIE